MKKNIIILLLLSLWISSCSEDALPLYQKTDYVSFVSKMTDTTIFSFFFYKDDEVRFPIEVSLTGNTSEEDRTFKIKANEKLTTLKSDCFVLPESCTLRGGYLTDTVYITLKNAPELFTNQYILVLDLVDGDLKSSAGTAGRRVLLVSDKAEKPTWWDNAFVRDYLGYYSRKKFELFINCVGEGDMGSKTETQKRILSLKFKHWLEAQDPQIYDDENEEYMSVEVIG